MGAISQIIADHSGPCFKAAGAQFRFVNADYHLHATTADEIIILKDPGFLALYEPMFEAAPNRNVLEFGVFEGGSIILFALAYPNFKFVGLDIRPPNEQVLTHIHDLGLTDRVKIHYNINQTDQAAVERVIALEFKDEALAIVSDDASHDYFYSKSTFQTTFGRLAPGGFYCLEDWAWAHWGEPFQTQQWVEQPALTNLVFEMLMLQASTHDIISTIEIKPALASLRRGAAPLGVFELDRLIRMRNRTLTLI